MFEQLNAISYSKIGNNWQIIESIFHSCCTIFHTEFIFFHFLKQINEIEWNNRLRGGLIILDKEKTSLSLKRKVRRPLKGNNFGLQDNFLTFSKRTISLLSNLKLINYQRKYLILFTVKLLCSTICFINNCSPFYGMLFFFATAFDSFIKF